MRAPSLRFRQVFEHGTHFKVQRPTGETITIAKKGLSPSTVGRLRRFATGGEVPPNEEPGTQKASAPSAPIAAPPVATPSAVAAPQAAAVAVSPEGLSAQDRAEYEEALSAGFTPEEAMTGVTTPITTAQSAREASTEGQLARDLYGKPLYALTQQEVAALKASPSAARPSPVGGELELTAPSATPADIAAQTAREVATEERARAEAAPMRTPEEKIRAEAGKAYGQARVQSLEEQAALLRRGEMIDAESKKLEAQIEEQNKRMAKDRETIDNAERDLAAMKNVGSYFSRLDTASKIGTALSLAAGALASGLTGGPNQAMKMYENAIEADIEKQKRDQQSLLNRLVRAGNRIDQAEDIVRSIGARVMANKLESASTQVASAKAKEGLAQLGASLRAGAEDRIEKMRQARVDELYKQGVLNIQRAELGLRREDQRRKDIELELEAAKLGQAGRKLSVEEAKLQAEAAEKKSDRSFSIPGTDIQLEAGTPAQARKAEEQILGQSDFINGANRVLSILKENPYAVFLPGSQARQDAQLAMAQMLERYTKSERFGRPLNVTASRVIKSGLPDLGAEGILNRAFGDPTKVIEDLLADVKQSQALAVQTYGGKSPASERRAAVEALARQHAPAIKKTVEEE